MRKLVYFVACTVDRFIAREDGSVDFFLTEGQHLDELFREFPETLPAHLRAPLGIDGPNRHFDAVVMGRHTYEPALQLGITSPYPHLQQLVVSTTLDRSLDPAVELVAADPVARMQRLKQEPGKDIWLCGGGELASALYPEIDDLVLKVNPVLLGAGIPLFARPVPETAVQLLESHVYPSGFQRLHYRLARTA